MRSIIPSPLKLARLALLVITLAALLHVSLLYAQLLHHSHFGAPPRGASKSSVSTVRRILDQLRAAQEHPAQAGFDAGAVAGGSRWGGWGRGRGAAKVQASKPSEKHKVAANGRLETNPAAQHPVYQLVSDAKERWSRKLGKASRSLPQAVGEYRRRYGRDPPAGFEDWWTYVKQKRVQLPDEYDQIFKDLEPFWALRPSHLRQLARKASELEGFFVLRCRRGQCTASINEAGLSSGALRIANERAQAQLDLLKPVERWIPDVDLPVYAHDTPWQFVGHDLRSSLEDAASLGEYYDAGTELDNEHLGWASACAPTRPLRSYDRHNRTLSPAHTFISSHALSMDPCQTPSLVSTQGFLLGHGRGPGPSSEIYPALSLCKTGLHADVLAPVHEGWTEDIGPDPAWEQKTDRVLWRGSTTGVYAQSGAGAMEEGAWARSQRMTLVDLTQRTEGSHAVLTPTPPGAPVGAPQEREYAELNSVLDVGFTDPPVQCDPPLCERLEREYAFKARVGRPEHNLAKYLLDVDGNGWSARFKRLMSSRSAVLKATIFPEWYADRVQEWLHYIPIAADMGDLYDVTQFFLGPGASAAAGSEEQKQRDAMGKEIGEAGREWSRTFWRHEDMVAYQFRLALELARLFNDDRQGASYAPPMSDGDIF